MTVDELMATAMVMALDMVETATGLRPCPDCEGTGYVEVRHPLYGSRGCPDPVLEVNCRRCGGRPDLNGGFPWFAERRF